MAEMTIQPTDVDILEEWLEAWRFAVFTLHLISAKAQGVPTTDAEYRELLTEINTVLNNTSGGVLYYGAGSPIVDTSKEILMMVKGVDPSQTALVGASPVTDVTTTGLEVGGALATAGAGLFSKVGRKILISSIVAALGLQTIAALIPQEQKTDLYTSLDPYADEDGNVLVHTDSDGKTRVPKAYIDAVRTKLINMGAFDSSTPEIIPPPDANIYVYAWSSPNSSPSRTTLTRTDFLNYKDNVKIIKNSDFIYPYQGYNHHGIGFRLSSDPTITYYPEYILCNAYTNGTRTFGYIHPIFNPNVSMPYNSTPYYIVSAETNERLDTGSATNYATSRYGKDDITKQFASFELYVNDDVINANSMPIGNAYINHTKCCCLMCYAQEGSGGVEGIEKQDSAVIPSDPSIDISTYMPAWSTDKKTFKALSYDEDRHIEGLTDIDFYPVTLTGIQGENQDVTTPQEDAITGDAPSVSDMDYIFPAIQDFYEFIHNYPDYPDIVIKTGDSGDTPPENPDLLSGSSNGLWAIYNPSLSEVQQFGAWLWSNTILDQITRMFNSPIDAVIGFHMIYCTPTTGASKTIKAGYLDSPVSADEVTNQYAEIDCGTVTINEYYRNALDYDNTRISLFLPFIGIVPLDTNVVMGSQLSILYRIDVLTGTCLAQIKVIKENSDAVMYTFQGNCAVQIPLTATTYTGMVGALLSGISAGASIMTGNIVGAVSAGLEGAMRAGTGLSGVRQSGTIGANAGALGIRIPYVIITHPVSAMSDGFNTLEGLPSNELVNLSSVSGFTRVTFVHLENIPATMPEIEEIQTLLETGVIF